MLHWDSTNRSYFAAQHSPCLIPTTIELACRGRLAESAYGFSTGLLSWAVRQMLLSHPQPYGAVLCPIKPLPYCCHSICCACRKVKGQPVQLAAFTRGTLGQMFPLAHTHLTLSMPALLLIWAFQCRIHHMLEPTRPMPPPADLRAPHASLDHTRC